MKTFTNSITYGNAKYECVQLITSNAPRAYWYAYKILKQRWANIGKPEVEDVIGKDAEYACYYAKHILKKRWADIGKPEVEDFIEPGRYWCFYKLHFNLTE